MATPKKMEAQWSMHGMGFGITREELETLFASSGQVSKSVIDAVWSMFHCDRNNNNGGSSKRSSAPAQEPVIDAVGIIVTYFLLSNASPNSKISSVFNFMDFNNRSWISGSELTILLMSLAYTLEDVSKNVAKRVSTLPVAPDASQNATAHDESDAFIEELLGDSSTEKTEDGDHRVDYVAFFDGMHRILSSATRTPGVVALSQILNSLDPSNEVCRPCRVLLCLMPRLPCAGKLLRNASAFVFCVRTCVRVRVRACVCALPLCRATTAVQTLRTKRWLLRRAKATTGSPMTA